MRMFGFAALAALGATSALAAAPLNANTDGYSYFNRPGADLAAHDADVKDCQALSENLHQARVSGGFVIMTGGPVLAAGAGSVGGTLAIALIEKSRRDMADDHARPINVENCMVVKGWRVVVVDRAQGDAYLRQAPKARAAQMAQWVGAAVPPGTVTRVFANDAAVDKTDDLFSLGVTRGRHLSVDTIEDRAPPVRYVTGDANPWFTPDPPEGPRRKASARPPKPLGDAELGGVPPGMGLIAVNMKGETDMAVAFERVGKDPKTPAWVDGRPGEVYAVRPRKAYAKAGASTGVTYVFAVPPGRWRLASVSDALTVNFCLGSPAFDLAAGEAVYAGSYRPDHLVPDMDMAPAKAAFPGLSTVPDKLRPAAWINGVRTAQCAGSYIYALEIPDRPFVDGYALGSRAAAPRP